MAATTTYLVTGANRGIGRGLADLILTRPNTILVALVRNPNDPTSVSLPSSAKAENTKVVVLPYEASDASAAESAISALSAHGIHALDVVIANAGAMKYMGSTVDTPVDAILDAVRINTIAPLLLFRACLPLLQSSSAKPPKFIAVSSAVGSTTIGPQLPISRFAPYGISKAALNHTFRKLAFEHPDIVVELMTPGPVMTDLGRDFKELMQAGLKDPAMLARFKSVGEVTEGMMKCIDEASLRGESGEGTSGGFRDYSGQIMPW